MSSMLCRSVADTRHVSQYFERTASFGLARCHLDLAARTLMTNKYLFDVINDDINWCIGGLLGRQNPSQEIHHLTSTVERRKKQNGDCRLKINKTKWLQSSKVVAM